MKSETKLSQNERFTLCQNQSVSKPRPTRQVLVSARQEVNWKFLSMAPPLGYEHVYHIIITQIAELAVLFLFLKMKGGLGALPTGLSALKN